jgi:glycosyltransferase involved in cell wall biosynthesis
METIAPKKPKVSILTTIKDKNDFLANTFLSIKNQVTSYDFNLCIVDDGSKESPLPIIKNFFDEDKIIFKRHEESVGIAYLASSLVDIIPNETDFVIYQSCDVIWYHQTILQAAVDELKLKRGVVSPMIANFRVPTSAWTADRNFYHVLEMCNKTKKLIGEPKDPRYLFLAGMRKDDFIEMAAANDYQCDEWTRKTLFEDMKLPFYILKNQIAVHQCHPHVLFDCKNIERCPNEWCNRKTFKKLGIELPFNQGYYDATKGTFEIPLPKDTSSL